MKTQRITRKQFQDAIEYGIRTAALDGEQARRLREVGRTAKESVTGDFFYGDCKCPIGLANPEKLVPTFPGSLLFATAFDSHIRAAAGTRGTTRLKIRNFDDDQAAAREAWADALEKTKREQCQTQLGDDDGRRCCLGVLADVAIVHGVIDEYNKEAGLPPQEALKWVGLDRFVFTAEDAGDAAVTYSTMNDSDGLTFAEIAAKVRETL